MKVSVLTVFVCACARTLQFTTYEVNKWPSSVCLYASYHEESRTLRHLAHSS
jgi:hypothetical protein